MNLVKQEPVVSAGLVSAVVALAAAFGFHWSAAVVGPVLAGLSLVLSAVVRSRVTPVKAVKPAPEEQRPAS